MTRITHKLESAVSRRMADEVGTKIKTSITIFTQTELMFATLRAALFYGKLNAWYVARGGCCFDIARHMMEMRSIT